MAKKGLRSWVAERWVDIANKRSDGSFPPCGRKKGEKRSKKSGSYRGIVTVIVLVDRRPMRRTIPGSIHWVLCCQNWRRYGKHNHQHKQHQPVTKQTQAFH